MWRTKLKHWLMGFGWVECRHLHETMIHVGERYDYVIGWHCPDCGRDDLLENANYWIERAREDCNDSLSS